MKKAVLVIFAALLSACSNPKDTVIPTQLDKLSEIKPAMDKLTPDEKELVAKYIARHTIGAAMGGILGIKAEPIPEGMKIGKAIDEQREFEAKAKQKVAEEKALKEKLIAEREKAVNEMRNVVTVVLVKKELQVERGYSGITMDEKIAVTFGYKNNSDKDIAGVKGTIDVVDLFGDELSGFNISNDTTIKAGGTVTWSGTRSVKFGMNQAKDRKFAELADDKFKVIWKPKVIVFADGSKLTAPDE